MIKENIMGNKSIFTRQNVHDKKMRLVIVRLDYICDCQFNKLKSLFDAAFIKTFLNPPVVYENHNIQINLSDKDFVSISRNLNIPIDEIKELEYVRYTGFKKGNCFAILDISQCYMCLTIKCDNNYDGLTDYVEPIKGAFTILQNKGVYLSPKRFGIRKIRVEDFGLLDDINMVFEPFVYNIPSFGCFNKVSLKSEYIDVFLDSANGLRTNVRRTLERVVDSNKQQKFSATLDIDAYFHLKENTKINLRNLLDCANQKEFEIYKECMSYEYLKSIYG